jgi:autotransporter-associated beta strand protein
MLLATSALASAALPITVAHADPGDATWNPGNADFNADANWTGTPDKTTPAGIATFNASSQQNITFTQATTLGGITVTSDARDYAFTTNNVGLTFTGAGLSVGSGASLTLNVSGQIPVDFTGSSTAGNATIVVNLGALDFFDKSTADNAFIESVGAISFHQTASGGTAHITLVTLAAAGGTLDISQLTTAGTTIGSLDGSGDVFLGNNKFLAIVKDHQSTVFSGVIQDGSPGGGGGVGGRLIVEGATSTLTLTGSNKYTGGTEVAGGALIVDGSIASSSGMFVNGNGTLAGIGVVPTTLVNPRGTLAPGHSDGTFGTLTVQGSLTFTAAATYLIQVSPATAANTHVTGTATLGGATVAANFAPGTYVKQQYGILHADGGLNSTSFGSLVPTNLSPMLRAFLSYDGHDVFLNLGAAAPDANAAGLNTNQRNVANAIVNSLNLMSGLPDAFTKLTPAGLTQISGETAVGSQQATFDAMNQFMGVMLDPAVGALSGGRAFAQANDAYASMARKAPLSAGAFDARWGVWAAGFGGSQSVSGDAVLGSNKTTSNVFGTAAGAEYRFSPNTVAGFALAGGGTHFNVANGGSGNSDLFQAGAYVKHTQGAAFLAAALAYGWQDVTTNRTVTVAGIDSLRARFNANAVSGRLEGGYRVATAAGDLTPYAAGQFTTYRLPSYVEQATAGANTFALTYNGKDVTATRTELGLRSEKAVALTDSTLVLRGRLAWAHDYNTDRNVQAAFVTLPGSAFVVNGAQPAADTALTTVSAETLWRNGWSAAVTADAQLSDTTHSYSGKGVVRYNW